MFAINHAATALIIKKMYPDVPMTAILVSVQPVIYMSLASYRKASGMSAITLTAAVSLSLS